MPPLPSSDSTSCGPIRVPGAIVIRFGKRGNYNPRMRTTAAAIAMFLLALAVPFLISAQQRPRPAANDAVTILKPARVFDGETMHEGWAVRVKGERIDAAGPEASVAAAGARVIDPSRRQRRARKVHHIRAGG